MKLGMTMAPNYAAIARLITVKGTLLDLPREKFADYDNPSSAFRRLLNGTAYCEMGHPVEHRTSIKDVHRWRTIDIDNVCGSIVEARVIVTDDRVTVTGTFVPGFVKMQAAVQHCLINDGALLSARTTLNGDNLITQIEAWDLVTELKPQANELTFISKRD